MIKIYGIDTHLNPIKAKMSGVLQDCMNAVIGLPAEKRVHRFFPMPRSDFFYPEDRSDAYTIIEINLIAGRKEETKKALVKAIFYSLKKHLSIDATDVEITILEQPAHCWGFRGITGDEAVLNYTIQV